MINKNDHIFITGGTGFLGQYIVEELQRRGYSNLTAIGSRKVDLKVRNEVGAVFRLTKPAVIIHAAAICGGIGANKEEPARFLEDNVRMNTNVVEAAAALARNGILKKFVGVGSVCSYGKYCPLPFKENDLWEGKPEETNLCYGLSKRMLLAHINAYREQDGFPGIFLIPVNLYGKRDSFDPAKSHVVPALIRRIDECMISPGFTEDLVCWGTGSASRELFYVEDAARGIVDAMEKYDKADPVNLGNGQEITILQLVEMLAEKMNYKGNIIWDTSKPDGQPRRCLDVSRAKNEFGFEAKVSLSDGLDKTIAWYKENKGRLA